MPLRDHFRPPLAKQHSWDQLHGGWPMVIATDLNRKLPARYVAAPNVHLGSFAQIDVVAFDENSAGAFGGAGGPDPGGVATSVWAPPTPNLDVDLDLSDQDEYEVRVYDVERDRELVAAVEIVSPSNKDRGESRGAFVAKCAALLKARVSVVIVDLVTTKHFNLYAELLDLLGRSDPHLGSEEPAEIYVAACRWIGKNGAGRLQTWSEALAIGQPLPTLPLWLADKFAVKLELEPTYEEACRALRIG
jgi:hypothetical protein